MAAERPPHPQPPTPGAAPPAPADAETPQDPSQAAGSSPATRLGESSCSQEFVLDRTFALCDPEQTGTVTAQGVLEYLQEVTGRSGDEGQLQVLRRMLDPEAAGAALDLPTFHLVMRQWIASCQRDGGSQLAEERDAAAGDLGLVLAAGEGRPTAAAAQLEGDGGSGGGADVAGLSPSESSSLRGRAERLAARNAKLQRDLEAAEELNARLAEEAAQLRAQLRCSQQALDQARAAAGELEDLTAVAKGLEEENRELQRQAQLLEKEQRSLRLQAQALQEENQQLLAEQQGLAERSRALALDKAELEAQLRRGSALLSSHDTTLAQAKREAAELSAALEGYDRVVQELRLEASQLRAQLSRVRQARDADVAATGGDPGTGGTWPWCPLPGEAEVPAQPLSTEIKETEEEEEEEEEAATPRPPSEDSALGQHPDPTQGTQVSLVPLVPLVPRAPRALLLLVGGALVALVALVLLVPLCILPPPGPPAWPQLRLRYWRPPPQ